MTRAERSAVLTISLAILAAAGVAAAVSQGGASVIGLPLFACVIALAFLIQWATFVPAYVMQSERFFDITGSITFVAVTGVAVGLSPAIDARSVLLLCLVGTWAIRLGTFLLWRVHKVGKDARFDEIKISFSRFLMTWTLQGLWVSLTLATALAAITSTVRVSLDNFAWVGLALWLVGFGIEALADVQKSRFRSDLDNKGNFIQTGLWSWSRHPNYFGEILLWTGVAVIALPVLRHWQWVSIISPVFVTLLLTRISGVPMLERRADEKWGGQEAYEVYKKRTSILIPWPPRRSQS
ncbi:DUF1295 domain-containing protein [Candidatus Bipolaricaulota bacterium]